MNVKLVSCTPDALDLLIFTKNTRLMGDETLETIKEWDMDRKLEELAYMKDTIKSSWEFVDYVFQIEEASRAFTHQLVRTRTGSYAQQSQRTVDARGNEYLVPLIRDEEGFLNSEAIEFFKHIADISFRGYEKLIDDFDVAPQDARGVLPTATYTEIIAKFTLRGLHEMAQVRLCTRTQGEYQDIFRAMRDAVIAEHPWAKDFIKVSCAWDGICAFPRYKACPVQKYTYNGTGESYWDDSEGIRSMPSHESVVKIVEQVWTENRHEATPVAKNGKTM